MLSVQLKDRCALFGSLYDYHKGRKVSVGNSDDNIEKRRINDVRSQLIPEKYPHHYRTCPREGFTERHNVFLIDIDIVVTINSDI
jgi:hypothetical protein